MDEARLALVREWSRRGGAAIAKSAKVGDVDYASQNEIARAFNVSSYKVGRLARQGRLDDLLDPQKRERNGPKKPVTVFGIEYPTQAEVGRAFDVSPVTISHHCRKGDLENYLRNLEKRRAIAAGNNPDYDDDGNLTPEAYAARLADFRKRRAESTQGEMR